MFMFSGVWGSSAPGFLCSGVWRFGGFEVSGLWFGVSPCPSLRLV